MRNPVGLKPTWSCYGIDDDNYIVDYVINAQLAISTHDNYILADLSSRL